MKRRSLIMTLISTAIVISAGSSVSAQPRREDNAPGRASQYEESRGMGPGFENRGPGRMGGAGFHERGQGGRGKGGLGGIIKSLELTPEQRQKLMATRDARQSMWVHARDAMRERERLSDLMLDPSSDEQTLLAQLKRLTDAQTTFQELRIRNVLELRKVLTPEQQSKLTSMLSKQRSERGRGPLERQGPVVREKGIGENGPPRDGPPAPMMRSEEEGDDAMLHEQTLFEE